MKFTEMLSERWQNAGSMLCVGLDPNPTRFPVSYTHLTLPTN